MTTFALKNDPATKAEYQRLWDLQPYCSPYLNPAYLDIIAPNWSVLTSYDFLFPVVPRWLLGLRLFEQPLLSQHFALLGEKKVQAADYTALLHALGNNFHHVDLCLDLPMVDLPDNWKREERITYRLQLPENTALLRAAYSSHLKRILKKQNALVIQKNVSIAEFMPFLEKNLSEKTKLPASFYTKAAALLQEKRLDWQVWGAYAENRLVAACAICCMGNQRYYQLAANAPMGKELNAMHQLLDVLLAEWCGQDILFDFEGSMLPGLQRFYSGFGAKAYIYTRVSHSKLPWPLSRWKHGI